MAFWKKFYKSRYTGAEIDAAVAKAGTVPTVTEADAGKALVVDEEGKIVAGEAGGGGYSEIKVAHFTANEAGLVCDVPYATITADIIAGAYYVATFPISEVGLLYGVGLDSSGNNLEFASGPASLEIGTNYIEYMQATATIASDESCTYTLKKIKITATVSNPS